MLSICLLFTHTTVRDLRYHLIVSTVRYFSLPGPPMSHAQVGTARKPAINAPWCPICVVIPSGPPFVIMHFLGLAYLGLFVSLVAAVTQKRAAPEGFVTTNGQAFELDGEPFVSSGFPGRPLSSKILFSITWALMPTSAVSHDVYCCRKLTLMPVAWSPDLSNRRRRDLPDDGRCRN